MITPPSVTQTHSGSTKGQILNFGEEKRERERERERQRQRQTDRQTDRQTETETERFSTFQILNKISSFMKSLTETVTTPNPKNEYNENFINPWLPRVIVNQRSQINCYNGSLSELFLCHWQGSLHRALDWPQVVLTFVVRCFVRPHRLTISK